MKAKEYFPHTEPSFMADELLPCPFCGATPELIFIGNGYTKTRKAQIKCPKCRIQRIDAAIKHSSEWVAKVAINHWNKRHQAKSKEEAGEKRACPCNYGEPCKPNCTCVNPFSSAGCEHCCSYGSIKQREFAAKRIKAAFVKSMTDKEEKSWSKESKLIKSSGWHDMSKIASSGKDES